jgi:hypothetical protein
MDTGITPDTQPVSSVAQKSQPSRSQTVPQDRCGLAIRVGQQDAPEQRAGLAAAMRSRPATGITAEVALTRSSAGPAPSRPKLSASTVSALTCPASNKTATARTGSPAKPGLTVRSIGDHQRQRNTTAQHDHPQPRTVTRKGSLNSCDLVSHPALGVLQRLRPARAFGWHRAYPCPVPSGRGRGGTITSGSHVHGCSVVGLGIRLYPCGIVIGYAVDLHRDLPARTDETQTRSSPPSQSPSTSANCGPV